MFLLNTMYGAGARQHKMFLLNTMYGAAARQHKMFVKYNVRCCGKATLKRFC